MARGRALPRQGTGCGPRPQQGFQDIAPTKSCGLLPTARHRPYSEPRAAWPVPLAVAKSPGLGKDPKECVRAVQASGGADGAGDGERGRAGHRPHAVRRRVTRGCHVAASRPDLRAALRTARAEDAERSRAVSDVRGVELARLEVLQARLDPVLAQVPDDIDMFDAALMPVPRPRLFIDMIGFVEMAHRSAALPAGAGPARGPHRAVRERAP